jgi:predicted TIM-barrel fold metal-dependent hydrolase
MSTVSRGPLSADVVDFALKFPAKRRVRVMRPDPVPESVRWPLVSADDHLLEPRDVFEGRMPAKFVAVAPRIVEDEDGMEWWQFEDRRTPISGGNAPISWVRDEMMTGPVRYDELRRGTWDVHERVKDMDRNGIAASLCFPSMVFGFCGRRFLEFEDEELALASLRAYNQWLIEEWYGAYPHRFIPSQLPWLLDVEVAAEEIRRNAALGFTSVSFSENPQKLGLPSIHTGYWDPFVRACEETGTVVNLHVGSSSETLLPSTDSPLETMTALFQVNSVQAAADWLFSGIPLRFPEIRFAHSEGGIGWLPMLLDRLRYMEERYPVNGDGGISATWQGGELTPSEGLRRNFFFSAIYDRMTLELIDELPIDNIMMESDYPHADSTWPHTQQVLASQLGGISDDVATKLTHRNAMNLYRVSEDALAAVSATGAGVT